MICKNCGERIVKSNFAPVEWLPKWTHERENLDRHTYCEITQAEPAVSAAVEGPTP